MKNYDALLENILFDEGGPREGNSDDERIVNGDNDVINDDNEESEGIAYEDGDEEVKKKNSDNEGDSDEEVDPDSVIHEQNPKENSF